MDAFTSLSPRLKILIVACTLFLGTLSMGLLVLGEDTISKESALLEHMKEAAKADLLFVQPGGQH